jgi:hypothetical protein
MRSILTLFTAAALVLAFGGATAQPLPGAIFTTTPDGGIVNENVRYESKLEVYLDGGPPPNAPQKAAGLPDGWYVFQITDPSGWVLLSDDPAKCRIVEVKDDIIIRLVAPGEMADFGGPFADTYNKPLNGKNSIDGIPCHIQDDPDGVAGASGQHDTNIDLDYGPPALVVQMMPYLDTPNPGGVYKAWVTPIDTYYDRNGDLNTHPKANGIVKKKGVIQGYKNDPGFGPPRSVQKTDNFKVKEQPPMVHVFKYHDLNGNGVKDDGEPEITGWEITITETLYDGTVIQNTCYTPCSRTLAHDSTVTVTEASTFEGKTWEIGYVIIDDEYQNPASRSVGLTFGPGELKKTVEFGNFKKTPKSGIKFKDLNANGVRDDGEPALEGWTINVIGTTGMDKLYQDSTTTNANGEYKFMLPPGTYDVYETCPAGNWYQSLPKPAGGYKCGDGKYTNIVIKSDDGSDKHKDNDFGNFQSVHIIAKKFNDLDGDGMKDTGEEWLEGVEFCLLQGGSKVDASDFLKSPQDACLKTDSSGAVKWENLFPNEYTVDETVPTGSFPTATHVYIGGVFYKTIVGAGADEVALPFLVGCADKGYAKLVFGDGFKCVGLTPGYWSNWRNHYTDDEFTGLLAGTIAVDIASADAVLNDNSCDGNDAINCMRKFLLANQLTLNLTAAIAGGASLFNGDDAGLSPLCQVPGYPGSLGSWLDKALAFHLQGGGNRNDILEVKTMLDYFANLEIRP